MTHHLELFYIVDESREELSERWIAATFARARDAQEFVGNVGGEIHTVNDDGMAELIERYNAGDHTAAARHQARASIAEAFRQIGNLGVEFHDYLELIERYAADLGPPAVAGRGGKPRTGTAETPRPQMDSRGLMVRPP